MKEQLKCTRCDVDIVIDVTRRPLGVAVTFTLAELIDIAIQVPDAEIRERCLTAISLLDPTLVDDVRTEIAKAHA